MPGREEALHSSILNAAAGLFLESGSVVSASGFYALMIRWVRGRLRERVAEHRRQVPAQVPDAHRTYHVPRECDFSAEELAEWYTGLRLQTCGIPGPKVASILEEARTRGWRSVDGRDV